MLSGKILTIDEANGIMNYHNTHQWSDKNPHTVIESRLLKCFSINEWTEILGDRSIKPFVLPNT